MKAILLAAGYATRLHPLTLTTPKPLLEINGRTILDYICDDLDKIDEVDEIIVVTNNKFTQNFVEWSEKKSLKKPIKVVNDGTLNNDDRLGAIGDIDFVINQEQIDDDLMILAGDSFYTDSLIDFYKYYKKIEKDCLIAKRIDDIEFLKRCGVVKLDKNNKTIHFEEKPLVPKSNYLAFLMYILTKESVKMFKEYIEQGHSTDNAGSFIAWLYPKRDVYAYKYQGEFYDIGTLQAYKEVREKFEQGKQVKKA